MRTSKIKKMATEEFVRIKNKNSNFLPIKNKDVDDIKKRVLILNVQEYVEFDVKYLSLIRSFIDRELYREANVEKSFRRYKDGIKGIVLRIA